MSSPAKSPKLFVMHGLLSTPLDFAVVAQTLLARGIAAEALAIPGYTLADRKKPVAWTTWLASVTAVLNERVPADRSYLGCLCAGGALAAKVALRLREKKLVVLEESYHMITIDNDRHHVADARWHASRWSAQRPCTRSDRRRP